MTSFSGAFSILSGTEVDTIIQLQRSPGRAARYAAVMHLIDTPESTLQTRGQIENRRTPELVLRTQSGRLT